MLSACILVPNRMICFSRMIRLATKGWSAPRLLRTLLAHAILQGGVQAGAGGNT